MRRIAFVGNSPVIPFLIERLAAQGSPFSFTFFPEEKELPYFRHRLPELAGKKISPTDAMVRPDSFYQENNVQICDQKIVRLNPRRKRMTTEDKQSFEFDVVVFSGVEANGFSDLKGSGKTGVYYARRLADVNEFVKNAGMTEAIFIQADDLCGLRTMAALLDLKREFILVSESDRIFSKILDEKISGEVRGLLEAAGVRIFEDNAIAELLGESDAKAVRLKSGKVLAAQAVLFTKGKADVRLLKDMDIELTEAGIKVDAGFQSSVEGFFAVDQAVEGGLEAQDYDSHVQLLEEQARIVAGRILGLEEVGLRAPLPTAALRIGERDIHIIGQTGEGKEAAVAQEEVVLQAAQEPPVVHADETINQ